MTLVWSPALQQGVIDFAVAGIGACQDEIDDAAKYVVETNQPAISSSLKLVRMVPYVTYGLAADGSPRRPVRIAGDQCTGMKMYDDQRKAWAAAAESLSVYRKMSRQK